MFQNCEEDQFQSSLEYVTFGATTYSTIVDVGGSQNFEVVVYTSQNVGSDTSFTVSVDDSSNADPGSYVVPNSVTVPAGSNIGILSVTLSDVNLGIGVNQLVIAFDGVGAFAAGGTTTIEYIQKCTEVTGTLDFVFDGYGSEVGWNIKDSLGGTVASGGGYSDGQATASENITLCAGRDYTLTITDSFGDGLSFPADGTYTLTIGGGVKASGGGDYGSSETTEFDTK
ncbi:hypothetical protein L3X39_00920 [Sabulilitoribacter multivorans]|uniref:Calx-beta domain-containing protein n=1 Tax=Flaviramulus multivorans TaxID=1304750 RepID=A0ABS9IEH8_9FLAO|nr:hypothetical protein [Flaviramulus multivorans]